MDVEDAICPVDSSGLRPTIIREDNSSPRCPCFRDFLPGPCTSGEMSHSGIRKRVFGRLIGHGRLPFRVVKPSLSIDPVSLLPFNRWNVPANRFDITFLALRSVQHDSEIFQIYRTIDSRYFTGKSNPSRFGNVEDLSIYSTLRATLESESLNVLQSSTSRVRTVYLCLETNISKV